jgi:integrase
VAPHPHHALTALKVNRLKEPGKYADGNGLYLVVDPSGAKRWLLRTVVHGRRRDMGLGGVRLVSLAEARDKARQYRKIAREGGDPIAQRKQERKRFITFQEAAERVFEENMPSWKNPKHAAQWINTLRDYAFPLIGSSSIDQIDSAAILRVLSPIWLEKPETAKRVKQRLNMVFEWAIASGHRDTLNPVAGVAKALPRQAARPAHHKALRYQDMPAFMSKLKNETNAVFAQSALALLICTATRTNEVIQAEWHEFDLAAALWTIPAKRMKAGREHRVPLSTHAVTILEGVSQVRSSDWVFPGQRSGKPLSNMAMLTLLKRMKVDSTVHGFRSSFRDWAAEQTAHAHDVCEMALAHAIPNKAEAAYRRGDLLEKRRQLMEDWSAYLYDE